MFKTTPIPSKCPLLCAYAEDQQVLAAASELWPKLLQCWCSCPPLFVAPWATGLEYQHEASWNASGPALQMVHRHEASQLARFDNCVQGQLPLEEHQDDRKLYDGFLRQRQPKGVISH